MATRDPMFEPRLTDDAVTQWCRDWTNAPGAKVPHVVAHAIVARRVAVVADPDAVDGPIGRFIRTGEVPAQPGPAIWWRLFGPMYTDLPEGIADQAAVLAVYLGSKSIPNRPAVDGWPCTDQLELTRKD